MEGLPPFNFPHRSHLTLLDVLLASGSKGRGQGVKQNTEGCGEWGLIWFIRGMGGALGFT